MSAFGPRLDLQVRLANGERVLTAEESRRTYDNRGDSTVVVTRRRELRLGFDEWDAIRRGVELTDFWRLGERDQSGLDGWTAILDVQTKDRSHSVARWLGGELCPFVRFFPRLVDWESEIAEGDCRFVPGHAR